MNAYFNFTMAFSLCALLLSAQDRIVQTEKLVLYTPFRSFFEKHKELKEIRFYKEWVTDSLELDMIETDTASIKIFNHFDLDDAGSRYFFQKRFGAFTLPSSLYTRWLNAEAENTCIWGTVHKDSVFFTIQEAFHSKNDSEKHFIKIEARWGFQKGLHVLAKELENNFSCMDVPKTDSIIAVKFLLEKTGKLTYPKLTKGNSDDTYTKELIKYLSASGPWIPYEAGGRPVRRYITIYVRPSADQTYQIAVD